MKEMIGRLCEIFETQGEVYALLLEQTLQERELLRVRDSAAIGGALKRKEDLLMSISELDHQRIECLRFFSRFFDESLDDMTVSFIAEAIEEPFASRLVKAREVLLKVTTKLKEENIRNGLLAGRMYEHACGRTELLKNLVNAANGLYGKSGYRDVCHSVTG
jgi:flagellar biosynthesis/type III secretory pathway chaperone